MWCEAVVGDDPKSPAVAGAVMTVIIGTLQPRALSAVRREIVVGLLDFVSEALSFLCSVFI